MRGGDVAVIDVRNTCAKKLEVIYCKAVQFEQHAQYLEVYIADAIGIIKLHKSIKMMRFAFYFIDSILSYIILMGLPDVF